MRSNAIISVTPLKGNAAFAAVFAQRRRFRSQELLLAVEFTRKNDKPEDYCRPRKVRAGVVVRKKVAPSAVLRNRIKRLLRESLRQCAREHPEWLENIHALVAIWDSAPKHPRSIHLCDVLPRMEEALKRVHTVASRSSV